MTTGAGVRRGKREEGRGERGEGRGEREEGEEKGNRGKEEEKKHGRRGKGFHRQRPLLFCGF